MMLAKSCWRPRGPALAVGLAVLLALYAINSSTSTHCLGRPAPGGGEAKVVEFLGRAYARYADGLKNAQAGAAAFLVTNSSTGWIMKVRSLQMGRLS